MNKLSSKEVRQIWIDFWSKKGHKVIESKSLIPQNDPTLLWINSGVATLKDYFSGKKTPSNPRLTNSQKSIRTNDIENVGVTARHHTLFEMLGNFSIGEYFKSEVLEWAYELLFDVFKFDKDKIFITYYSEDKEAYEKWISLGISKDHLIKGDKETNFWDIGLGPCGPDTEIFYDRGEKYDPGKAGLKLLQEDIENDRYIEIWNIVFSEFNNDGEGNYEELFQKNIDTGAGLERLVSIFQDAPTNFDTDLFLPIIEDIEKLSRSKYVIENYFIGEEKQRTTNKHFRIIADHIRAVAQAINDGAKPSNTQRGYIIRRLIRRAYRSGLMLGVTEKPFLHSLVDKVQEVLPLYKLDIKMVKDIIRKEEEAFEKTITQGEELLNKELEENSKNFDFSVAFKLYETYGFPIELTQEILEDRGVRLDISRFDEFKEKHAEASRGKIVTGMDSQIKVIQSITKHVSTFTGYSSLEEKAEVVFQGEENGKHYVLLDKTPFYATGGGQQGDTGVISELEVLDIFKDKHKNIWHVLETEVPNEVIASVDKVSRLARERNHSATHLLGYAISKVFSQPSKQLGSDNNDKRLRYDFPLEKRPTKEEIVEVERVVNSLILKGIKREYTETSYDDGIKMGAVTLEGEDYGDEVRVVSFGDVVEFCGGTHISNTKLIENFKITSFDSKGSGVFRIEAVTSNKDVQAFEDAELKMSEVLLTNLIRKNKKLDESYALECERDKESITKAIEKARNDFKTLNKAKSNVQFDTNVEFTKYNGMKTYVNLTLESSQIKGVAINLREAHPDALIIVGATNGNKVILAVASSKENSKEVFDKLAKDNNGRGGGNSNFAMGNMDAFKL